MIPAVGWIVIDFCGFIAGSALLLIPGRRGCAAFAAVIVSVLGLALAWLPAGLTLSLANATARVCAAGGHLASRNASDWFDLIAEIPMIA